VRSLARRWTSRLRRILIIFPFGEIAEYIVAEAKRQGDDPLGWDIRNTGDEDLSSTLRKTDRDIILRATKAEEVRNFIERQVKTLQTTSSQKASLRFVLEDYEVDPLWYLGLVAEEKLFGRDDFSIFAANQVLFSDLLDYATNSGVSINCPRSLIIDTTDEERAVDELTQFVNESGRVLVTAQVSF
jgi:hypothetical protein